jgi:hypothetical protein
MAEQQLTPAQRQAKQDAQDAIDQEKMRRAYNKALVYPDSAKEPPPPPLKKAKGGSIRGCGCETKGKTKGRFV